MTALTDTDLLAQYRASLAECGARNLALVEENAALRNALAQETLLFQRTEQMLIRVSAERDALRERMAAQ